MYRITLIIFVLFFTSLSVSAQPIPPITITPMQSAVGDTFMVLGQTYRIVEMEFIRYDTDEPYIIKFPALSKPATTTEPGLNTATVVTQWVDNSNAQIMLLPNQIQISGFPAGAVEAKGSQHNFFETLIPNVPLPGNLTVHYGLSLTLSVAIGPETIVTIFYNMQQQETTIDNLIDVIPLFDVIPMREQRIMEITELRTLLNYVQFRAKGTQPTQ